MFETEGRHASAKVQDAIDHLESFCRVERRFHRWDLNHQPLPWDLGISLPSSDSLRSSRTSLWFFLPGCVVAKELRCWSTHEINRWSSARLKFSTDEERGRGGGGERLIGSPVIIAGGEGPPEFVATRVGALLRLCSPKHASYNTAQIFRGLARCSDTPGWWGKKTNLSRL